MQMSNMSERYRGFTTAGSVPIQSLRGRALGRARKSLNARPVTSTGIDCSSSRRGSPSLTNASMHLRLNLLDEKRYAQITETRFVFPDVLFFYLANYVPESSRSTEHYPTRRKVCIRQDTVGQDACPILMEGIDLCHETQLGARIRETLHRFFKIREVRGESSTSYIPADASRGIGIVVSFAARKRTARVNSPVLNESVARRKHILPFRRFHIILLVVHYVVRDIHGKGADLIGVVGPDLRREH